MEIKLSFFVSLGVGALLLPITDTLSDLFITNFVLLFVIGVLTAIDALTGVTVAFREKKLSRAIFFDKFFVKYVLYTSAIITAGMIFILTQNVENYRLPLGTSEKIISYPMYVITTNELWSIGNNIGKLYPKLGQALQKHIKILKR